jgi:hypothetical protein
MGMFDKIREDLNGEASKPTVQDTATFIHTEQPEIANVPAVVPKRIGEASPTPQDPRKCTAHTSGLHGEKRPCRNWAIKGGRVCKFHGGSAPQVKKAAQRRLDALLMPAIERLAEIADQDEHLPSALGAVNTILNHTKGKPGDSKNRGAKKGPTIIIGVGIGALQGVPQNVLSVQVQEHEPDEDFEEAEILDDNVDE